ncbi:vesicle coat component [Steccherinum ochraceum]|uniref:Vesicle coat component n=1 Tax=Steccherinum ochraceum TaxID=92696 RepID=A0A4R0RP05_9APHY|nr:vesicle coat component [Steccherinum ochraceum]
MVPGSRHTRFSQLGSVFILAVSLILLACPTNAIKFEIPAYRYPPAKCIWNAAHPGALIIVTANVGPGENQRVDIEIVDSGADKNTYLHKKGIKGESRFAVTAHSEGDVGVCFRNYLDANTPSNKAYFARVVDLDVDIGADAVDYNAIANQESLSGLETEMRKLEGVVKEIVDEMEYLKTREERFQSTNLSTNTRVQNFAWFTLFALVGLGVWQIFHLRAFFKRKYLID